MAHGDLLGPFFHTKFCERVSKNECDRRIAGTDARPTGSFRLRLRVLSGQHPRDIPDHSAASNDTIVHQALTPMASRILHARSHMQRGMEMRGLEEESTLECRVECHTRRCVSRGSVKD